jgi:hypothetical protein
MTDVCTELEANLVAMLRAADALRQVRTIEAEIRTALFTGAGLTKGFAEQELPAIGVSAEIEPAKRGPYGAGEVQVQIPLSIFAVARAQRKTEARARVREMQAEIEHLLDGGRRSANGLGENAIVLGDITSTVVIVEDRPYHFAIGETQCQVLKVVQL